MVTIIAEAGVNHNGKLELAKQLIDVAAAAGVDYVKFQTFNANRMVTRSAAKANYQQRAGSQSADKQEGQRAMLKRLELSQQQHYALLDYCGERGVQFFSTAFDLESLDFLRSLGQTLFKVPSGELTNLPYLEKVASFGKPTIVSTGMANLGDIEAALAVLRTHISGDDLTVLHCNTQYPTPMRDVNLRAMTTIQQAFKVAVGYSDHTLGIEVPVAAVALGASCIEKHFTLSRQLEGPDHAASLEPAELNTMVKSIRNIELALGEGIKQPSSSERENVAVARKSIYAARDLPAGHVIAATDLIMLRPGDGLSPMLYHSFLGKKLRKDILHHERLRLEHLA